MLQAHTAFVVTAVVRDAIFHQTLTNSRAWKGDAVQLAFDARTDAEKMSWRSFDSNDWGYTVALTPDGPRRDDEDQPMHIVRNTAIITGLLMGQIAGSADDTAKNPNGTVPDAAPLQTYRQTLVLETDSPGAIPAPRLAPVYDGHTWALSTRWDDSNPNALNVRRKMLENGIRGTFYLNSRKPETPENALACALTAKGECSVGGHSVSHPKLPELLANEVFRELMANRIALECLTDEPVNSLAFPYGAYQDKNRPEVKQAVSLAFLRTGYHHCVYASFVKNNPFLPERAVSTGLQVVPGDRQINAETFWANLDKIRRFEEAYRETSDCIFLGVHPWQEGEVLEELGRIMGELRKWSDFWYCTQTEYAAFARQRRNTALTRQGATSFLIERPAAYDLGSDVPLTLLFEGHTVTGAHVDGERCEVRRTGDAVIINIPHAVSQGLPLRIEQAGPDGRSRFDGILADLALDAQSGQMTLTLTNETAEPVIDLRVALSTPPAFEPGIITKTRARLDAGERWTIEAQLNEARTTPYWRDGKPYSAAQIDFVHKRDRGRLFVTAASP